VIEMHATPLTQDILHAADIVIITTDHSAFDYDFIVRESKRVIDTRNATKAVRHHREKIVLLGAGQ
jgi:UDP-N-acetyl-D-glucosamine dehydrogenase